MNGSVKVSLIHPKLDSVKTISGETIPFIEEKCIDGEMSIDCHGRFVFRSVKPIKDRQMKVPFENIEFITIDKKDAQNLYDMLTWAMEQIKPGNQEYKDIDIFGDRAISYERLYDYLHGEDYHIKKQNMSEGES